MTVGSVGGSGTQVVQRPAGQSGDALSKSLQKQIAEAQQKLQEVSSSQEMSMEEKMQKRQEIQKQIFELQNQLRQHEMELRKEARQSKNDEMEEMLGGRREEVQTTSDGAGQTSGVTQAGMEAMISADSALTQAKSQGGVARRLKGDKRVLEGEIKLDAGRGRAVEHKQAALSDLEQRVIQAESSQIRGLQEASEKIADAVSSQPVNGTSREEMAEELEGESAPEQIYAQYNNSVVVEISGEGIAALRESQKN